MWFLTRKKMKFKKLPKSIVSWVELQTNKYEAIVYLVEQEIKENGFRDVSTDETYKNKIEVVEEN